MSGFWWDEATTTLIPGDPGGVEGLSSNLMATGDSIGTQASRLRAVNADIWKGEAAAKFAEHIKDTPGELDLLANRYHGVASALSGYASHLRDSQTKVTAAKAKAADAHASQVAAASAVQDAQATNASAQRAAQSANQAHPTDPPVTPSLTDVGPLQGRASDADAAMREAERLRVEAEHERDSAAHDCKGTIKGCISDDLKDQGGWQGWVKHFCAKIAPILAAVAAVVGIVALFIPGLNLIALGLAVLCLFVDSTNYFAFHDGDLLTVCLDVVGVAAFAGALKAVRAVRVGQEAEATANVARVAKTGEAIDRASNAKSLQGVARTQLGMTRGELRAARAGGELREVVAARQAQNAGRAGAKLEAATGKAADASHPFRTMVRETRELLTDPASQLSRSQLRQNLAMQRQLVRAGAPGAVYGGSLVIGNGAALRNGLQGARELLGQDVHIRGGVDKVMRSVPVRPLAPTAP